MLWATVVLEIESTLEQVCFKVAPNPNPNTPARNPLILGPMEVTRDVSVAREFRKKRAEALPNL